MRVDRRTGTGPSWNERRRPFAEGYFIEGQPSRGRVPDISF